MWLTVKFDFFPKYQALQAPKKPLGTGKELDDLDGRWRGLMHETRVGIQETEFLLGQEEHPFP
jgi:hypothetical protein